MSDGLDWMDVQAMIDKAVRDEKWSRNRHVESVEKDLRAEFRREVMELREEVGELVAETSGIIARETDKLRAEIDVLQRILDLRTEHLV